MILKSIFTDYLAISLEDNYGRFIKINPNRYFIWVLPKFINGKNKKPTSQCITKKDYSLKEISDYYSISRNAIYDQIKIVVIKLIELEEKIEIS